MHRAKLRWWAFRQFLHCCRLLSREAVRSLRVYAVKRKWRRPRFTLGDAHISYREDILRTCRRGHLNQLPFIGMEDDHPELKMRMAMSSERLVRIADESLERLEKADAARTGMLPGYAAAQRDHLAACESCRSFVCGVIIGHIIEAKDMRDLLAQMRNSGHF